VALDNTNPIPSGYLYRCTFHVSPSAELREYTLNNVNVRASNPDGMLVPTSTGNCGIDVVEAPTPTPTSQCQNDEDCPDGQVCVDGECVTATPTRTATPIGYCTGDDDCPDGQVCVNNMCVTPTPTRTPIGYCTGDDDCPDNQVCVDNMCVTPTPTPTPIGYCTDNEDCPDGQVCVNNMCVTVTPTARKKSGGGGCSCEIDPGARGRSGDVLAVLLPALILALRWRRRRA
jgi:MYXO-CTERM domain-containing protein